MVTFTPTSLGPRSGSITITDDAAGSPLLVSLSGNEANKTYEGRTGWCLGRRRQPNLG